MADVRRERIDLLLVSVEREGEEPALGDPEVLVEAALQVRGLLLETRREIGILPDLARQAGAAHLGVVDVALDLAAGARKRRERAVVEADRVPGILPALVLEASLLVAAL